jgi:alpha-amylase/alpha-mannosidase (GH57 family)
MQIGNWQKSCHWQSTTSVCCSQLPICILQFALCNFLSKTGEAFLMAEVAVAFLWHQHQPYYPDDVAGANLMPWVRLHGVKDYYGMALHLLEFPEMACTINLVPSLLVQLQAYTEHGCTDQLLEASRKPVDGLTEEDTLFLLDHFFMANPEQMIRPFPRYFELYMRRSPGRGTARDALRRFQPRDFRDLQVWFNLAWIHPLAFERDSELKALRDKGRYFTEADKAAVLEKHLEILRQVLPLHRELAARDQVELTTTPFYHPILPLLFDKKLAREATPEVKLPRYAGGYPDDAEVQVRRAVEHHAQLFGSRPRGMWPAEGSVCQAMLPLLYKHGIRWIATDEEILSASTQGFISRDNKGHLRNPDHMYRPYRVTEHGCDLGIVFRDHALSDLIGFHYQRSDPVAAADDFISKLHGIAEGVKGDGPALVSVILDGENCWEHYPGGGAAFLRALYERCVRERDIHPVKIGDFLDKHPPRDTLPHLFAGSWINHNFAIWVGHEEDNTAWDTLHSAREHLKLRASEGRVPLEKIQQAREEIYIAEGSDWFWWYGPENTSSQDALFDYLFRKHLQNMYLLLGDQPPPELARPISQRSQRPIHTLPRAFLQVKIDGRRTFFEWLTAGKYVCHNERGSMVMAAKGPIRELHFGFDAKTLFVRIDCDGPARDALAEFDALRVSFVEPAGWEVVLHHPGRPDQAVRVQRQKETAATGQPEAAVDQIAELGIAFELLGVKADQPIQFFVELMEGKQSRDRAPREGTINLTCPGPEFEQIMWDV